MTDPNKMVSYYSEHEISPVKQNITNLNNLFNCRSSLLDQLAININNIKNKNIIEIGPGSGHNGLFFAKLAPARYVMVEPNLTGIKDISSLFSQYYPHNDSIQICQSFLNEYVKSTSEKFDLVWCENMLSGVNNPLDAVSDLCNLVSDSGSLMITTMDEVSTFAENLRRLLSYAALGHTPSSPNDCDRIIPLLSSHLDNLKGMTRLHTDWVHDNIALPITAGYNMLSIPDVLNHLGNKFTFVSSSPRFYTDWRWYKNIPLSKHSLNEIVADEYIKNLHSFIDYRFNYPPIDAKNNIELLSLCRHFRKCVVDIEQNWDDKILVDAKDILKKISELVSKTAPNSKDAIDEACENIFVLSKNPTNLKDLKYFSKFFGRNQQHVHLAATQS